MSARKPKPARTRADIEADYHRESLRAGDLAYRIHAMQADLAATFARQAALNAEIVALPTVTPKENE